MKKLNFDKEALWGDALSLLRVWCGVIFIRYGLSLFTADSMADFARTLQPAHLPSSVGISLQGNGILSWDPFGDWVPKETCRFADRIRYGGCDRCIS